MPKPYVTPSAVSASLLIGMLRAYRDAVAGRDVMPIKATIRYITIHIHEQPFLERLGMCALIRDALKTPDFDELSADESLTQMLDAFETPEG